MNDRIIFLRNDLTLWAMGRNPLSLATVQARILELDNLLQRANR